VIGLFGGAFDPPHVGHVALAEAALAHFPLPRFVVLVAERPWHKAIATPVATRLQLARAAFPFADVELDPYSSTVELLEARADDEPLFLLGADQLAAFPTWREPDRVLELARLGVAARPGFGRAAVDAVLTQLSRPDRILFFELAPQPVASSDIRARAARGEPLDGLVPPAVARLIDEFDLYGAR
jgi:nicotinate-nucleotide adenylyltransferase